MGKGHLVITVHGIRTFGQWQERLESIVGDSSAEDIKFTKIDYGYFSVVAFFLPFVRWMATKRIERLLLETITEQPWQRIDIVAHSFGTHLVSWSLKNLHRSHRGKFRIHTLILAGSVLRPWFRWQPLTDGDDRCVNRVVNECGTKDSILVLSQFVILLTGMAGRIGFRGRIGTRLRNRYFQIGHSGYFVTHGQPNDFMSKWWLPLITRDQQVAPHDQRSSDPLSGLQTWFLQFAEPIKFSIYAAGITFGIQFSMEILTEARNARLDRVLEAYDIYKNNEDHERAALGALTAYSINERYELGRLKDVERAVRGVFSSSPFRFVLSNEGDVTAGAISKDGQLAAIGFDNGWIDIWELGENTWQFQTVKTGSFGVASLAFQPDSYSIVGGNKDGSVWIYRISEIDSRPTTLGSCSGEIESVSLAKGGQLVVAGTENGSLCLWNLELGSELRDRFDSSVRAVSFNGDGHHFALAEGNNIYLRSSKNSEFEAVTTLRGVPTEERITAISFSADSSLLAAASYQSIEQAIDVTELGWSVVRIWNLDELETPIVILPKVKTMLLSLALGPGLRLAASGSDGDVRIWELGRAGDPIRLKGFVGPALDVGLGAQSTRVLSVGVGGPTVLLWDYAAAVAYPRSFQGSTRPALSAAFCNEEFGTLAVGYQMDGSVHLFDLSEADGDSVRMPELDGEVVAVTCDSSNPFRMATGRGAFMASGNGKIRLWDIGDPVTENVLGEHLGSVLDVAILFQGKIVISVGEDDGTVIVWDTKTGESLSLPAQELGGVPLAISAVAVNESARFAVGADTGTVSVYSISLEPMKVRREYLFGIPKNSAALDVALSADGKLMAAAYMDGIVRVWAVKEGLGEPENELIDVAEFDGSSIPWRIAFSPDGSTLTVGDTEGYVYLWPTNALGEKASILEDGPRRTIYTLGFDPSSENLVAGFADGTVLLWPTLDSILRKGCKILRVAPLIKQQFEEIAAKEPCAR